MAGYRGSDALRPESTALRMKLAGANPSPQVTGSINFSTANAFQATFGGTGGSYDTFVRKFPSGAPPPKKRKGQLVTD